MGMHMRWFTVFTLLVVLASSAFAHHPDREHQRVHQRYDLIGPLGTRLPMSYRRRYNRPTYIGGKIAYWIAPSSQEAMAWHDATHRCFYKNHRPRIEKHFFYPKPWEVLRIGARVPTVKPDDGMHMDGDLHPDHGPIEASSDGDAVPGNPALSDPALSNPVLSNAVLSNPALSNPVLSNPVLSNPALSNASTAGEVELELLPLLPNAADLGMIEERS